jgi:hypothetical protein
MGSYMLMLVRPERKRLPGISRSRWQDYIKLMWIFKKQEGEA